MKHLKVGDIAPDFIGVDENNEKRSLKQFIGKKLVIYFYPKDNTPGCINQACNLRDHFGELKKNKIALIGISADSVSMHQKFSAKLELPFPLIADVEKKIINDYGVWGPKKFMGREYDGIHRTTFIINEQQVIVGIIEKPKTKYHAEEILQIINQ